MIPTLQKWCDDATAAEFWAKHDEQQALLDAQGENETFYFEGMLIHPDAFLGASK